MAYTRLTALWQDYLGAPGYTRLRFEGNVDSAGAASLATRVDAFLDTIATTVPSDATLSLTGVAELFNDSHELVGVVSYTPPAPQVGNAVGPYAAPSGGVIHWLTGSFAGGRNVRGRTFIVPMGGTQYDSAGTLTTSAVTALQNAAAALISGTPALVIPFGSSLETGLGLAVVTSASVPDKAAVLRSRRD